MPRNKFRAVPIVVDNIRFASKREAKRYAELKLLERSGEIDGLELQPAFPLLVNGTKIGTYKADFRYTDRRTGAVVIEDCKGYLTREYKRTKKHVEAQYGIVVVEV